MEWKQNRPGKGHRLYRSVSEFTCFGYRRASIGSFTNETSIELELPQETITLNFFETGEDEFVVTSTKIAGTYRVANYSVDRLLIEEADLVAMKRKAWMRRKLLYPDEYESQRIEANRIQRFGQTNY